MSLDRKLVGEAALKLWDDYHESIEKLGYTLSKDSFMQSPEEISIIAMIKGGYSDELFKKIREIIPQKYIYQNQEISVIISPSIDYIRDNFRI